MLIVLGTLKKGFRNLKGSGSKEISLVYRWSHHQKVLTCIIQMIPKAQEC